MSLPAIGGNILSTTASTLGQYILNRQESKEQRKLTLDMWNRENAYNHPTQQMQRLSEAGINPHMAYAKGTINNVAARSGDMPATQAPDITSHLQQFADVKLKTAQADNLTAQAEQARQKTLTEKALTLLTGEKYKTAELERFFFEDSYGTRQSLLDTQLVNSVLDANLKEFEKKLNTQGFTKSDSVLWRMAFSAATQMGLDIPSIYKKHKTTIDKIFGIDHFNELQRILKEN